MKKAEQTDQPKKTRGARTSPAPGISTRLAAEAYQKTLPALTALAEDAVLALNTDVNKAVSTVLTALPRLRELRPAIVEQLPKHPVALIDELESRALALWFAHMREESTGAGGTPTEDLLTRAKALREDLLVAAEALARRGLVDAERVQKIRSGQGHADLANDLLALNDVFSGAWVQIQHKTAVAAEEVAEAAVLGQRLLFALSERDAAADHTTDTKDIRARAFTLLAQGYDECLRAVAYLRWRQDDAEDFAPTLYNRRAKAKKGGADDVTGEKSPSADVAAKPAGAADATPAP